jgi:hypothetical protein
MLVRLVMAGGMTIAFCLTLLEPKAEPAPLARPSTALTAAPESPVAPSPSGLRPSSQRSAGVPLPEGSHLVRPSASTRVYRNAEPAGDVVDFFVARYGTERLDRIGRGGVFRGVDVEVDGAPRRVDISILPGSRGTRIQVHLLPLPPVDLDAVRAQATAGFVHTLD